MLTASESFSLAPSPIKSEFFHSKFAQKYPICRPKAGAKIGVVKKTSILLFFCLGTGENLPKSYCVCRTFCDTLYSFKCSLSSQIRSASHLMLVADATGSLEALAELRYAKC